eukprot:scaffold3357_cov268-Chaetoceros_neogracile.AAC.2
MMDVKMKSGKNVLKKTTFRALHTRLEGAQGNLLFLEQIEFIDAVTLLSRGTTTTCCCCIKSVVKEGIRNDIKGCSYNLLSTGSIPDRSPIPAHRPRK